MGNPEIKHVKPSNKTKEEIAEGFSLRFITPSCACEHSLKLKQIWQILEHNQDQSVAPGWRFCQWRTAIFFQVKESGSGPLDFNVVVFF